jgi:hypothetical protein
MELLGIIVVSVAALARAFTSFYILDKCWQKMAGRLPKHLREALSLVFSGKLTMVVAGELGSV